MKSISTIVTGSLLLLLPNGAAFADASAEKSSDAATLIEQASIHVTQARRLLEQLLREDDNDDEEKGQGGRAVSIAEFEPDGTVAASGDDDTDLEEEFDEFERTMDLLNEARRRTARVVDHEYDHEDALLDTSLREALEVVDDTEYKRGVFFALVDYQKRAALLETLDRKDFTYWDLHAYFSCSRVFASRRPIYGPEEWAELHRLYDTFATRVNNNNNGGGSGSSLQKRTYRATASARDFPLEAFQSREKGRGLRTTRDVKKGELVFSPTNATVFFADGNAWKEFLFDVYERNGDGTHDSEAACDVLVWSWVQALGEDGSLVVVTDMDNTSLMNEGRDEDDWEAPNVRCGKDEEGGSSGTMCDMYYATRDIKKGDEVLGDYRNFALVDAWGKMDL